MNNRVLWFADLRRDRMIGRFWLEPGGRALTRNLCSLEDALYKDTTRGRRKRTEAEVTRFLKTLWQAQLTSLHADAPDAPESSPTLQEVAQAWIASGLMLTATRTRVEYVGSVNRFVLFCGAARPLLELRRHNLSGFAESLASSGLSEATIHKHLRHLQVFLNWAYDEEHLPRLLRVPKPAVVRKTPMVYSVEELDLIESTLDASLRTASSDSRRLAAQTHLRVFWIARFALLRAGEILTLPLSALDLGSKVVRVRAVPELLWTPKAKQERTIPLHSILLRFISEDLRRRSDAEVWWLDDGQGKRYYSAPHSLSQAFRRLLMRVGLADGRKPVHAFRATGITNMLGAGGDLHFVQRIAGHSNPQTTLNHYAKGEAWDVRETVELLE